jgi:protein tyrosine/serine phosphatase
MIQVDGNLAPRYSGSYFLPERETMESFDSMQDWKDEVVRLMSEVVLFRLALDQETVLSKNK